jgi:hypothetical protein
VGRRKGHHTSEVGDPYAEGWEARDRSPTGGLTPSNPYQFVVDVANVRKQSARVQSAQRKNAELWMLGWRDRDGEVQRGED